jgi:aldehyde dehydrogenase (NAD+)
VSNHLKFFIDGAWVPPVVPVALDVIDPSTEEPFTQIAAGSKADVDKAVAAAKAAFPAFSRWTQPERLELLRRILAEYEKRAEDIAQAVSREMGAPIAFARESQVGAGHGHLSATIAALENYSSPSSAGRR